MKLWRHSIFRFYLMNTIWNFKFWIFSEKIYKNHTYEINDDNISLDNLDITGKIIYKKKRISQRRFVGYMYNNAIYLDNPGFKHLIDNETWDAWKKKKLVKDFPVN